MRWFSSIQKPITLLYEEGNDGLKRKIGGIWEFEKGGVCGDAPLSCLNQDLLDSRIGR